MIYRESILISELKSPKKSHFTVSASVQGRLWVRGHRRRTHPEVNSVADPTGERRVDCFIKLKEDLKSQLRSDLLSLHTNTKTQDVIII